MKLGLIDLLVLIAYFAFILWLGYKLNKKEKTTEDYFVAGRSLPGWAVGLSILGTCISSVTYVAYPGKSFVADWQYLVQGLTLPFLVLAGGMFLAVFYRRVVKTTVNEFVEARFGPGVRVFSLFILAASELARVSMVLYLVSLVINTITGWPIVLVIVVVGIITVAYTTAGGIEGTIWTDVLQTVTLVAGGVAVVALVSAELPGGIAGAISFAAKADKFRLFDFEPTLTRPLFYVLVLSGVQNFFYFLAGNQNQVQRYQCVSSDREARRAVLIGSLGSVPVWALFMLVGTMLFAYYHQFPDAAVGGFVAAGKGDKVFPHFIATRIPAGLSGLLLAGLFAAAMSSIDSSMNVLSTMMVNDLYRRFIRPEAAEERAFRLARGLTLFWGALGIGIALLLIPTKTFLDFYFRIVALLIGVITGLIALALFSRRAHKRGVAVGIVAGIIVTAWGMTRFSDRVMAAHPDLAFPWDPIMIGVVTTIAVAVVGYVASLLIPPGEEPEKPLPAIWDVIGK